MSLAVVTGVSIVASTVVFVVMCEHPGWVGAAHRRETAPEVSEKARAFHNERIYDNFKLFISLVLAILGGAGFLLSQATPRGSAWLDSDARSALALIVALAGWIPSMLVLGHRLGKLKRDAVKMPWWRHVFSGEWVMFVAMVLITNVLVFVLLPRILDGLSVAAPATLTSKRVEQ